MMALAFGFLFMPACATIAGLVVWATNREESLADGVLIRHFLFLLAICIALAWGVSRTDAVRLRLDPQFRLQSEQFRLQSELEAHPVYSTIKRLAPDDHKALHDFLTSLMSHGRTLPEAFLQARPLLTRLTNHRLGFAGQKSRLTWGRLTADTLRELQTTDPMLCYRALSLQRLDQQTLAQAFSAGNSQAFQQAVIEIYEAADRGLRHEPSSDKPVEFNTAALEYRAIADLIVQKFGESVAKQVAKREFPEPPIEPPEQVCSARIYQLEAMLQRPQAMASTLISSVLR